MKRIFLFITVIGIIFIIFLSSLYDIWSQAVYAETVTAQPTIATAATTPITAVSCAHAPANPQCIAWEQEILATTVRIQISAWAASADANAMMRTRLDAEMGHGTVMNGRYLVTHNHYHQLLDWLATEEITGLFSLYATDGKPLLSNADLRIISAAYQDSQTLVLDFHTESGQGLFDRLSIPSATFKSWTEVDLQPGLEVAQLDWDSKTANVDWVQIEAVVTDSSTPKLELASFNEIGSSGGGVFWQGIHIANNWQRTTVNVSRGTAVYRQFSTAALNSLSVVTPLVAGG